MDLVYYNRILSEVKLFALYLNHSQAEPQVLPEEWLNNETQSNKRWLFKKTML